MYPLCAQPPSVSDVSASHRWAAYLIGVIEAMLWSGPVFGWASLVHVLKTVGVYSHLCREFSAGVSRDESTNATLLAEDRVLLHDSVSMLWISFARVLEKKKKKHVVSSTCRLYCNERLQIIVLVLKYSLFYLLCTITLGIIGSKAIRYTDRHVFSLSPN